MKIKIRLYLESMSPLFIGMAIKNFGLYKLNTMQNNSILRACLYIFKRNKFSMLLLILGLMSVISLLINHNNKKESERITIDTKLKVSHSYSYALFVISYLIPIAIQTSLYGFSVKAFILLYICVLGLICTHSSLYYKNPILALLGYHIYSMEREDESRDIVVSEGSLKLTSEYNFLNVSDHVYFAANTNKHWRGKAALGLLKGYIIKTNGLLEKCISKGIVYLSKWYEVLIQFINQQPLTVSAIYSTAILLVMLPMGWIQWEGADDFTISQLFMGSMGESTPYVQVCSYYLGIFIIWLQRLAPICNWFTVLEILSVWAAFVIFEWFLIKKSKYKNSICALAFPIIFEPMFYMSLTYTRSALLLSFAGCIMLYSAIIQDLLPIMDEKKELIGGNIGLSLITIGKVLIGILLIVAGTLFRYACIFISMAYIVILPFSYAASCISKKHHTKSIIRVAFLGSILFLAFIISFCLNQQNVSLYNEWDKSNNFRVYNKARSDVIDYLPSEFSEDLSSENLEISYNDYNMLKQCVINDNFFTENYFQEVKNNISLTKTVNPKSAYNLKQISQYRQGRIVGKNTLLPVCVIMVFTALLISNKQNRIAIGTDILGTVIIICYFLLGNRLPPWVVDPIYMFAAYIACLEILAFAQLEEFSKCGYKLKKYLLMTILLVSIFVRWKTFLSAKATDYKNADLHEVIQYAESSEDIFLLDNISSCPYPYIDIYGPLAFFEEGQWDNIIRVGNWDVEHPARNAQKKALGIDSVIYSIAEGKSKLISTNGSSTFEMYITFFKEHYNLNVEFRIVKAFGNYGIFEAYVLSD